ncbi:DUF2796 domain-containing protein [Pseudoruegeria sp. SHC-113]|uniref:zinc uptake protein ZrgA n=1 Tax=Pseudoruegeria sp. SHC-113 TaxID=2855439 RepID=UPI0021BAF226|nr:DUF2796 domain-containing protein [Pseudoruegeria sp. SHC-113]MCT8162112.1 DUF2796 domain-containing protein [Pseudoruegeria sp. SHC-113]
MPRSLPRKASLLCSTLLVAGLPAAALASGEETREMGAHEHGHGALNIAIEGNTLAIELEVPGFDIVGFEHAPESDADKAAVEEALAKLSEPLSLFVLPEAAGCQVSEMLVELHGEELHEDHEEEHDHDEKHEEHAEGHDHDDEKHEEHAEGHDHDEHEEHAEGESHSEFHAAFLMTCEDASKLTQVELAYFNAFPNAEELEVQLVTDAGARSVEASGDAAVIDLN